MAIPLVIDDAKIKTLREFGESHRIPVEEVRRMITGDAPVAGDRPGHALDLPVNFRVVFSIEETPLRDGTGAIWLRRMSMSLAVPGRAPNIHAVRLVAEGLGFPPLKQCMIDVEHGVVNIACEEK